MQNIQIPNLQLISNSINMDILDHGHLYGDKNWKYYNVTSPFNRLYFVLDGEGFIENNFHKIKLQKGYMYLIPCNTTYNYICEESIEKFYIHFNLEYIGSNDLFASHPHCSVCKIDHAPVTMLITNALSTDLMDTLRFKSSLMYLITLFDTYSFNITAPSLVSILKYKNIFQFIKNNCFAYITTQDIADYAGMNIHTLSKNFKKDFGITPKQYLNEKLTEKAKQELLCTPLSIKNIAYTLGFNDEFYFSRFFKNNTDTSPTEYRHCNSLFK